MPYRKEEYEANGHQVTIQQVNEGGKPSAWIDGKAAYEERAMEFLPDCPIKSKVDRHLEHSEHWDAIAATLAWMTYNDQYFCKKCNNFYHYETATSTGFAGHKCGECASKAATCDENPDGDRHEDKCLNPHQKHNARVSTKYKCKHCGRTRKTVPTG